MNPCEASFISAGLFVSKGKWIHPRRKLDTDEIIFCVSGSFSIAIWTDNASESVIHTVQKNDVLLLPAGHEHAGTTESEKVSFYWVHFQKGADPYTLPDQMRVREPAQLIMLYRQLLHAANTSQYPPECADYFTRLIIIEIASAAGRDRSGRNLVRRMEEYIRMHRTAPVRIADMAEHFGYNRDYLTRLFRRFHSEGLKTYIDQARIRYMEELLSDNALTLTQVAAQAGFDDYKYFLKFFSHHMKMTPTEYRELYRNIHYNDH